MMSAGELAGLLGGSVVGDGSLPICGVSSVEDAETGAVVVADDERYLAIAMDSPATAIVTSVDTKECDKTVIHVADTTRALMVMLDLFRPESARMAAGISPASRVGEDFRCGASVTVCHGAYVGDRVVFGDDVVIYPSAYVGDGVHLGSDVIVHPNATIYPGTEIGNRVIIHAGAVIGSDGYGYTYRDGKHWKVPQIGKVIIEDDVEIGANTTIDRAKFGVTRIGRGTKIDNLVHIAHNCKIGENCIIVAQVGIAGSTTVGNGVVIAGQAGIKDHVRVGDNVVIAARSGVVGDVAAGEKLSGFPARGYLEYMKAQAAFYRLPELLKSIKELDAKLSALEVEVKGNGEDIAASR